MWHDKNIQFPCHPCYIFEYFYLHKFPVNFLVNRHLSRDHRISYIGHHLEQTDNKPFSGLIEQLLIKAGWRDASFGFCNLAKAFKHNAIHLVIKTVTIMIRHCYCLVVCWKWRLIIWYRKINITFFIFPSKNV